MTEPWLGEIDDLRARLNGLIERTDLDGGARELASEALEELAVAVEEMQTQNAELLASRSSLEHERSRYRDLFETVLDGYVITDERGLIREANTTACNLFGRSRAQLVNKPLAAYVGAGDQRLYYTHLSRMNTAGVGGQLNVNLTIGHGDLPANLRATLTASTIDGQREIRWLIHDRRADIAAGELQSNEERLRALFETAGVGIMLCGSDGQILFSNQQADQILARDPEGAAMADWFGAIHPDDTAQLTRTVRAALDDGVSGSLRHRIPRTDRDPRWVDHTIVPFLSSDGTFDGFVSTLADVTAEHTAQLLLEESRDFTSAVLDTVGALVVVLDREGRIQRFNKACEAVTGLAAADVLGQPVVDLLVPRDQRASAEHVLASVLSLSSLTNGPIAAENEWLTADGSRRLIAWTNTALVDTSGDITSVIGTGIDITDQRLLESRLAQADRLDSIGMLAAGIAHDFNNTLGAILMRIGRLRARNLDQASQDDLADAEATINRTQTLIADLMTFSRVQKLTPVAISINAACERMSALLEDLLGSNIDIELNLTSSDTTAFVDPARFDQILTNLAINARDAMPEGGTITLTTGIEEVPATARPGRQPPPQLRPGSYVRLTFTDTGRGIDPAILPHVFDPYFTTKPPTRGTGLGLATTYGAVTQSGGAISVESRPGAGTKFTIWIPHTHPVPARAAEDADATSIGRPTTVLVVDDDADLLSSIVDELNRHGYSTLQASDAERAIGHLDDEVDVLITDIQLPGMDGIDLAQTFRQHIDLPVIFITGALRKNLQKRLAADATVLTKPFVMTDLVEALAATGSGPRRALPEHPDGG